MNKAGCEFVWLLQELVYISWQMINICMCGCMYDRTITMDNKEENDRYSNVALQIKYRSWLIVRVKTIKYYEGLHYYLPFFINPLISDLCSKLLI